MSHRCSTFSRTIHQLSLFILLLGGCGYNPHQSPQSDASTTEPTGNTGGRGGGSASPDAPSSSGSDARRDAWGGLADVSGSAGKLEGSGGAGGGAAGTSAVAGGQSDSGGTAGGPGGTQTSTNLPDAGVGGSVTKDAAVFLDVGRDVPKDAPPTCTPACAGKCSGDDGCGGICPNTCVAPQTCGGGGVANICGCKPVCTDKCSGNDTCGGTCPNICVAPLTCGGGGISDTCGCKPVCTGKCAGDDGCGGICPNVCDGSQSCGGGGKEGLCGSPPACTAAAGAPIWTKVPKSETWPSYTANCPLVFDKTRSRFVIFTREGKTWEWDPATSLWQDRTPTTSPPAHWCHGMAFDSGRNRMVMFGGRSYVEDIIYSDTWEWDGSAGTWTRRTPSTLPPEAESPGMVYDPVNARTIMVQRTLSSDQAVWEWDGNNWTSQAVTGPSWGSWFGLTWDSDRNKALGMEFMTTGTSPTSPPGVWEWQHGSKEWTRVGVGCTSFVERNSPAIVYVPGKKQVLFYGGVRPGFAIGMADLWTWSPGSTAWQKYDLTATAAPPDIYSGSLVNDTARGRLILLASENPSDSNLNELWQMAF